MLHHESAYLGRAVELHIEVTATMELPRALWADALIDTRLVVDDEELLALPLPTPKLFSCMYSFDILFGGGCTDVLSRATLGNIGCRHCLCQYLHVPHAWLDDVLALHVADELQELQYGVASTTCPSDLGDPS